jgi:S-formylglutathione hydrolase FrmB
MHNTTAGLICLIAAGIMTEAERHRLARRNAARANHIFANSGVIIMRQRSNLPFAILQVLALALLLVAQVVPAQPRSPAKKALSSRVQDRTFHSKALDREMHYMIALPAGYGSSQRRYPVLYLLHGWAGDYKNWVTLTNLLDYSESYPMIIVTPDAQNSWYVNSATIAKDRFEDYIADDLIREIDGRWRTIALPHRRAIAGLSMGGYGSLLFGLKHADLFAVAGSVSGALDGPVGVEQVMPVLRQSTDQAYGAVDSVTRTTNNIFSFTEKVESPNLPYLFLECGAQDPFLPSNRKFVNNLSLKKIPYEYHEYPGAHDWEFWDNSLPMMLKVIATRIVPDKSH